MESLLKKRVAAAMKKLDGPPLWKGPVEDGVTYSMLTRFLSCRERFRVAYILGLGTKEQFSPVIEYGQIWHACEEALAANGSWKDAALKYCRELATKFPHDRKQIDHWLSFALVQFPVYVDHWKRHSDVKNRTPLFQEKVFDVKYKLPNGKVVRLRGKRDAVDLIGAKKAAETFIQENKTKSQLDDEKLRRQLTFDLQSMLYVATLKQEQNALDLKARKSDPILEKFAAHKIAGVRYNVVRRSAHKSVESFTEKLMKDKKDGRLDEWFGRWTVPVSDKDVKRFEKRTLVPVLTQLCEWYDWIVEAKKKRLDPFDSPKGIHWQHPFGSINWLDEGGSSDVDSFLSTGSTAGLRRKEVLFTELAV